MNIETESLLSVGNKWEGEMKNREKKRKSKEGKARIGKIWWKKRIDKDE